MKLTTLVARSTQFALLFSLMTACAGGVDPNEDPVQPGDEENNAENLEGNNANFENENNGGNEENLGENEEGNNNFNNNGNNGNNLGNNSELENNAEGENFLNNNNQNLGGNENNGAEENSDNSLGISDNSDILVNGNQSGNNGLNSEPAPNIEQAAVDTSVPSDEPAPAEVAPAASDTQVRGGRVKYVKRGGTGQYDQPNGSLTKELEQGDHPLVSGEGEWVQTSDGKYIQSSSLSTQPVPRNKSAKAWR